MQIKSIIVASSLAMFATAKPTGLAARDVTTTAPMPASQCNTSDLQCCNSVQNANSAGIASLLGLLGVVAGSLTGQVGLTCSSINVITVPLNGNSCSAQPVCCSDNSFNGLVALGCTPVNVNL